MNGPIIIGLGHRSGHGKDTAGKFLDTTLRHTIRKLKVTKTSFAAPLKAIAYQLYSWAGVKPGIHYENHREDRDIVIPEINMTVVDLWVSIGEKMRAVDPLVWIRPITHGYRDQEVLIITDVRHPNEANMILECGGRVYNVDNPRVPRREGKSIDDMLEGYTFTGIIKNDGEIKDLNMQMIDLAGGLIKEFNLGKSSKPA